MNRLTHKVNGKYYPIQNKFGNLRDETYGKLGQLEDIEELFGIDLIFIFKVGETSKKKNTTSISILDEWFKIVWNYEDIEDDYKDILCNYNFVLKDLERLENIDKKAVGFIQFLINSISKKKLNDEQMEIMNMETGEEYGSLKEYITKKMKELFDVDIKWNI